MDVNGWGDPLTTDSNGDGSTVGEDILTVDAQYANEFIDLRFQLNEPLNYLEYCVFIGYDFFHGHSALALKIVYHLFHAVV